MKKEMLELLLSDLHEMLTILKHCMAHKDPEQYITGVYFQNAVVSASDSCKSMQTKLSSIEYH